VVLSKGHEVVGPGYSRLTGAATMVMDRGGGGLWVTPTESTRLTAWIGKQIGLAATAQIDGQFRLAELATQSRKKEVPVGLLTRKAGLWGIWLTRKARLQKIWLTRKAGLHISRLTRIARL
jgi:hypothetical protein